MFSVTCEWRQLVFLSHKCIPSQDWSLSRSVLRFCCLLFCLIPSPDVYSNALAAPVNRVAGSSSWDRQSTGVQDHTVRLSLRDSSLHTDTASTTAASTLDMIKPTPTFMSADSISQLSSLVPAGQHLAQLNKSSPNISFPLVSSSSIGRGLPGHSFPGNSNMDQSISPAAALLQSSYVSSAPSIPETVTEAAKNNSLSIPTYPSHSANTYDRQQQHPSHSANAYDRQQQHPSHSANTYDRQQQHPSHSANADIEHARDIAGMYRGNGRSKVNGSSLATSGHEHSSTSHSLMSWSTVSARDQGPVLYHGRVEKSSFQEPCSKECERQGGICLLDSDFRAHCVLGGEAEACHQFQCLHGDCVITDGLYTCQCDKGWVSTFCDQPCSLDCGPHGYCARIDEEGNVACICHWNYTGYICEEERKISPGDTGPRTGLQVWEIAAVSGLLLLLLALVCVVTPYFLWRRQWVPMRKLVFFLQDYEDKAAKEYDAFISYTSTPGDERFVLQDLYPKLEKELHFRLCLHFRDFPPGEPIANNIIYAIERSSRTILVLSPSYVASEWCRLEYQTAQHQMLKLKHKIIPILLEDVTAISDMDKNLKAILDTVTYIKWPGMEKGSSDQRFIKFWKLVELSMPKKKCQYNQFVSSYGCHANNKPFTVVCKNSLTDDFVMPSTVKESDETLWSKERSGETTM